jgi:hypothetical protein
VFRLEEKTGNLSDLKTGQPAKVQFQRQGASVTALLIGIGFSKKTLRWKQSPALGNQTRGREPPP